MCGIIGIITRREDIGQISFESVKPTFVHRGPNDYGEYHAAHVHLGHARLSIQDLTAAGHQPMASDDGRFQIVFNGEIYNFIELRSELEGQGRRFRSHCDTEVLLEAFREWGPACVHRLRGMFAFTIWDSLSRKAWLFRDRFGEKPLFYRMTDKFLLFASELKSMVSMLPEEPTLSITAFDKYLHFQFVPEPETPVEEIKKCPRSHFLELDVDSWSLQDMRYWDVASVPPVEGDPTRLVAEKLEDAVRVMLRADVDVGLALSGGIDSGAIAAFAKKNTTKEIHSFGIGYPGHPVFDERNLAKAQADRLGIHFHDREVVTEELAGFLPGLISAMDEPIADIAAFGHFSVAKSAADAGLRVLLTGIGGDELFWGYPWFREAAERNHALQQTAPGSAAVFYDVIPEILNITRMRSHLFLPQALALIPDNNASSVYTRNLTPQDIGNQVTELMFDTWLVGNCLSLGDKVSMASSIETRLPFLDVPLVETVIGLRKTREDFRLGHKRWLIDSLRGTLPDQVLDLPKQGFAPPVAEWIIALCNANPEILTQGVASSRLGLHPNVFQNIDVSMANKILVFNAWYEWCVRQPRQTCGTDVREILRRIGTCLLEFQPSVGIATQNFGESAREYSVSAEFESALEELVSLGALPTSNFRMLDLGCNEGLCSWSLARAGYSVTGYESTEFDFAAMASAKRLSGMEGIQFEIRQGAFQSLPFPDRFFQGVWMRGMLTRSDDLAILLAEVHRVLAPGGLVVAFREQVAWNSEQMTGFQEQHPLRDDFHGENAHFLEEILKAFALAELKMERLIDPTAAAVNSNHPSGSVLQAFDVEAAFTRPKGTDLFSFAASRARA